MSKSKLDQCCAIWVLCWTRIGAMLGSCWVIWWAILVEKKQSNLIVLFGGAAPEAQVELLNLPPWILSIPTSDYSRKKNHRHRLNRILKRRHRLQPHFSWPITIFSFNSPKDVDRHSVRPILRKAMAAMWRQNYPSLLPLVLTVPMYSYILTISASILILQVCYSHFNVCVLRSLPDINLTSSYYNPKMICFKIQTYDKTYLIPFQNKND